MSYGNYAPFYRTGYFNPIQTPAMPNITDNQNQFVQGYQPPIQAQQMSMQNTQIPVANQPFNDMLWVLNETEATSYPVAPGNRVILWDKNSDTVYIKSVNAQGVPSMEILDYTKRTPENASKTPDKHVCNCGKEFVRIEDFEALRKELTGLSDKVNELTALPATVKAKAKAKEESDNG